MDLKEYNSKRNFDKTPEPRGKSAPVSEQRRFVIQRHAARKLHYDLRLEIEGTLKSWAVPRGPSMNPADKRLAIRTEDHPVKYLQFQGTIPKGNYGAGEMIIWDHGTFDLDTAEYPEAAVQLRKGNLKIIFHGRVLKGKFSLVRTGNREEKESWLLIKKEDAYSTAIRYDAEDLLPDHVSDKAAGMKGIEPGKLVLPMLASTSANIFNDPGWYFELKWDGYRAIAHLTDNGVLLQSRHGVSFNKKFTRVTDELGQIAQETILDGEIVIVNDDGVSQFGELQNYPESSGTLLYYVFDMLYLNGHSMLDLPLKDRKSLIPEVLGDRTTIKYCDHVEGMGTALYEKATSAGLEGVMAKKKDSRYVPGIRSENWLKVKSRESMDVLICGYTESRDNTLDFGSLILGIHDGGKLKYVGNCGSGFSRQERKDLLNTFHPFRTEKNPFDKKVPLKDRQPRWLLPEIQGEVTYSERTKNGLLRHPVYKQLLNVPVAATVDPAPPKTTFEEDEHVEINGARIKITNLNKIYWPEKGYTKYDLIDYYLSIADTLIPYLKDRPQSLHRHPDGITGEGFFQKDSQNVPEWAETLSIYSRSSERDIAYLLCQNTQSLIFMANLGCIEINPWNSRKSFLGYPDYGIIDLDPPADGKFKTVVEVARTVGTVLNEAGITGYCKTSGAKGLHVYVPMGAKYSYEEVRTFIKLICQFVAQINPGLVSMERQIRKREGKIYLDYLQNRRGQTVASVYSVRPVPGARVSAPLSWDELRDNFSPADFTIKNMADRLRKNGDLFSELLHTSIDMEKTLERLENLNP